MLGTIRGAIESNSIDSSIILSALVSLFILFSVICYNDEIVEIEQVIFSEAKTTETVQTDPPKPFLLELSTLYAEVRSKRGDVRTANLEEHSEYTAVMYATVPLGRYYLTGYNHEETGSKQTASGAICHQGTITTCAADPRYHKFGEYLEIEGRLYRVEDTGSAVKKKHIDLYFAKYSDMARYGSHYAEIYRVEFPFGKPKDN